MWVEPPLLPYLNSSSIWEGWLWVLSRRKDRPEPARLLFTKLQISSVGCCALLPWGRRKRLLSWRRILVRVSSTSPSVS